MNTLLSCPTGIMLVPYITVHLRLFTDIDYKVKNLLGYGFETTRS